MGKLARAILAANAALIAWILGWLLVMPAGAIGVDGPTSPTCTTNQVLQVGTCASAPTTSSITTTGDSTVGSTASGTTTLTLGGGSGTNAQILASSSGSAANLFIQPKGSGDVRAIWNVGTGDFIVGAGDASTVRFRASSSTGDVTIASASGNPLTIQSGGNSVAVFNNGGTLIAAGNTAVASGGSTTPALAMSNAGSAMGVYFGSSAPTISAPQGSLYLRTDGSTTSTRLYVNTNGSTGWTSVTTAS